MLAGKGVLFPTDFSLYAKYAMNYAMALAKQLGGELHVAHVMDSALFSPGGGHGLWLKKKDMDILVSSMEEHANARLDCLLKQARDQGISASKRLATGKPAEEAVRLAGELGVGLVVLPTHGRSGFDRIVYGSVCERVVRHSPVPVLTIKHPEHEFVEEPDLTVRLERVLFPTDFSDFSDKALPYAASLCREFGAKLTLVHVAEMPVMLPELMPETAGLVDAEQFGYAQERLAGIAAELAGIEVDCQVRRGQAHREICALVDEHEIDLCVLPTHGRSGIAHVLFGSVAEKVVRSASCPVMTVRPEMPESKKE